MRLQSCLKSVWGLFFFTLLTYLLLVIVSVNYLLSFWSEITSSKVPSNSSPFLLNYGLSIKRFYYYSLIAAIIVLSTWSGPSTTTAFGHLSFTLFEKKITLLVLIFTYLYFLVLFSTATFSSSLDYDYVSTLFSFTYWLMFLFLTTNILSLIFVVEILTGLITLLVITSYNSSTTSSSVNDFYFHSLSTSTIQSSYFYSLLTFFWISLLTTLTLFLMLLLLYSNFFTLEWGIVSPLFNHFLMISSFKGLMTLSLSWLFVLLVVFLKCAITPFFLWKPTFFKGLPHQALVYYVFIFYFFLFLFFVHFLIGLFSDLFFLNTFLLTLIMFTSLILLPSLLYENLNLKSFFAISSILNSAIILLATLNTNLSVTNPIL